MVEVAHSRELTTAAVRITIVGVVVNLALVAFKLAVGFIGHSHAMVADGVHSASDLITDGIVLVGLKAGRHGPDEEHHFGHGRIETLASALVGLALIVTAVFLGVDAWFALTGGTTSQPGLIAVVGAAIAVVTKEILYQVTMKVGRRARSPAIMANAWHHRSDAMSSVAVLVGVAGAWFKPEWKILDVWAALAVSLFIIRVGVGIVWKSGREFTDTAPDRSVVERIRSMILGVRGVRGEHELRIRTSGGLYLVQVHVDVDGDISVTEGHDIAEAVEDKLKHDGTDIIDVIVHIDPVHAASTATTA